MIQKLDRNQDRYTEKEDLIAKINELIEIVNQLEEQKNYNSKKK